MAIKVSTFGDFTTAKAVSGKRYTTKGSDAINRNIYLRFSYPVEYDEAAAIAQAFDHSCRCQHDCCGHWFSVAWRHTLRSNKRKTKWSFILASYQNV